MSAHDRLTGEITVTTGSDQIEIELPKHSHPSTAFVVFEEPTPHPCDPDHDHHHHDHHHHDHHHHGHHKREDRLEWEVKREHHRMHLVIRWEVFSPARKILWHID